MHSSKSTPRRQTRAGSLRVTTSKVSSPRVNSPPLNLQRVNSPCISSPRLNPLLVSSQRVSSQRISTQQVNSQRISSPRLNPLLVSSPRINSAGSINSALISRQMGFVVDKVSEDSFYENLLLGLSKVLEKSPCVSKLSLKRLSGVRQVDIRAWEHNNGVILPEDLRSFYSSTNGFLFTYEFSYDYYTANEEDRDFKQGIIQINAINELIRTFGYETKNTAQVDCIGKKYSLSLSRESKVFELAAIDENAKVVLVYPTTYSIPSIWFFGGQMTFSYLAEDFTTYFRMCIAHLGIPCWQYAFSKEGLPEWSREMFNIIAPGILAEDRNLTDTHGYKYTIEHINKIDPNIFSVTQSCTNLNAERPSNVRPIENKPKDKGKGKMAPKRAPSGKNYFREKK